MPSSLKTYRLQVETLTPVHVGSGESHDRLEYIISGDDIVLVDYRVLIKDPATRKYLSIELDKILLAGSSTVVPSSQNRFNANRQKKPFLSGTNDNVLIDFQKQVLPQLLKMCPAAVLNRISATTEVRNRLRSEGAVGKGVINSLPRSGNYPYLPGSSIKGALRTALIYSMMTSSERSMLSETIQSKRTKINELAQDGRVQDANKIFYDINQLVSETIEIKACFKDKKKNYFRHVRVSDVMFSVEDVFVDCVLRHSMRPKPNATPIPVFSELFIEGAVHHGDISVDIRDNVFSAEGIRKACNDLYEPQLKDCNLNLDIPKDELKKSFFLRIGGYAGAISKTFPETRCINVMPPNMRRDKNDRKGIPFILETKPKTHCLNERNDFPLGWILCTLEEV